MILDSSALVAIALDEPEREALLAKIDVAESVAVAAPTLVEAADAIVIEFGVGHWETALSAWWEYGKGRHPAGLNLGDCMAYAAARIAGEPLLAIGDDFGQTDIELA